MNNIAKVLWSISIILFSSIGFSFIAMKSEIHKNLLESKAITTKLENGIRRDNLILSHVLLKNNLLIEESEDLSKNATQQISKSLKFLEELEALLRNNRKLNRNLKGLETQRILDSLTYKILTDEIKIMNNENELMKSKKPTTSLEKPVPITSSNNR